MTTEQEGDRVQLTTAGTAQEEQPDVQEVPEAKAGSESESQTCSNSTLTETKETEESTAAASSSSAPSSAISSSHDVTEDDEKEKLIDGKKEVDDGVLKVPLRDVESGGVNPASVMVAQRSSQSYGFGSIASLNEQVISSRPLSSSDPNDLKELLSDNPPRWGWVVVLAAWVVMIPIAGVLASYGTVVNQLTTEFNSTKLIAGWVGSLSFGFTVGMCPVSTVLFSVYGARKVASVGILGTVTAAISTSFTNSIYVMFFTYSFLFGTGANFVYNTAMNLVGQYFPRKHQALATCLATAGISTGTLAINPLAQWLKEEYGWRWMYRIMSAAIFVVGFMCVAAMAPAPGSQNQDQVASSSGEKQEKEADPEVNYTESKMSLAAKELRRNVTHNSSSCSSALCANPGFILWLAGTLFWSISFLFPHIFLMDYMGTSLGIEQSTGSLVMLTYGAAELAGRFLCAGLAGCIPISLSYVYTICSLFAGAVALVTPNVKSLTMMFFYGASAGINSGILNALMFVTTMQLFGNKRGIHIWGYINIMLALGMVVGPIMAGGIFDATNSYESAFVVGGSVFILCGIVMAAIKPLLNRFPLNDDEQSSPAATESPRKPIYKRGAAKRSSRQYQVASAAANGTAHQNGKWGNDMTLQLEKLTELDEEAARSNRQSDDASAE